MSLPHLLKRGDMLEVTMDRSVAPEVSAESIDPRVLRSRKMLAQALGRLLNQKSLDDISVHEITDEAGLNRATFYLHYPDKHALLHAMTDWRFRELIARRGLSFSDCDGALRAIVLGVCDFLAESTGCPSELAKMPLEGSIIPVIEGMFREGGKKHQVREGVDPEMLATTAAWAVFGAARRWYQTPGRVPAEDMAAQIEAMVKPVLMSGAQ